MQSWVALPEEVCLHMTAELYYISLENYSGQSKSNFKDHYGDVVIKQKTGNDGAEVSCCGRLF